MQPPIPAAPVAEAVASGPEGIEVVLYPIPLPQTTIISLMATYHDEQAWPEYPEFSLKERAVIAQNSGAYVGVAVSESDSYHVYASGDIGLDIGEAIARVRHITETNAVWQWTPQGDEQIRSTLAAFNVAAVHPGLALPE